MNRHSFAALAAATLAACSQADLYRARSFEDIDDTKTLFPKKRDVELPRVVPIRELKEFHVQGHSVMAFSKADAITRLKASGKIKNKKKKKK